MASEQATDAENALIVARWCWDAQSWTASKVSGCCIAQSLNVGYPADVFDAESRDDIAAAEAVVRERGLGEEYGRGLLGVLGFWRGLALLNFDDMATIATAPLPARLAALAAVAREAQIRGAREEEARDSLNREADNRDYCERNEEAQRG